MGKRAGVGWGPPPPVPAFVWQPPPPASPPSPARLAPLSPRTPSGSERVPRGRGRIVPCRGPRSHPPRCDALLAENGCLGPGASSPSFQLSSAAQQGGDCLWHLGCCFWVALLFLFLFFYFFCLPPPPFNKQLSSLHEKA